MLDNELKKIKEINIPMITTREDYVEAGGVFTYLHQMKKKIENYWAEPKQKAYEAHKQICQKEKEMISVVEEREKILKDLMLEYYKQDHEVKKITCGDANVTVVEKGGYEITDELAIIKLVAQKKLPADIVKIDQKKLQQYIDLTQKIPAGVTKNTSYTLMVR